MITDVDQFFNNSLNSTLGNFTANGTMGNLTVNLQGQIVQGPVFVAGSDIILAILIVQTMMIILIAWYEMRRYKHALQKGGE